MRKSRRSFAYIYDLGKTKKNRSIERLYSNIELVRKLKKLVFTSVVDRDRNVPELEELRVPGKSRHRNTPMTACRTQRRSPPLSLCNATLVATATDFLLAEKRNFRQSTRSKIVYFFSLCLY